MKPSRGPRRMEVPSPVLDSCRSPAGTLRWRQQDLVAEMPGSSFENHLCHLLNLWLWGKLLHLSNYQSLYFNLLSSSSIYLSIYLLTYLLTYLLSLLSNIFGQILFLHSGAIFWEAYNFSSHRSPQCSGIDWSHVTFSHPKSQLQSFG